MVPAPSALFRYEAGRWGLAKPHFRHHEAWPHAVPPQHIQRQETCSSHGHSGCRGHITQQLRLEAGPPILHLWNEEDARVLEKSLVVVESFWAHLLELSHPLSLQDLLYRRTALPNAGRAARTQCAACCCNKWTGDTGCDPDDVLKNAIIRWVDLVVDIEPERAAGKEVEQTSPAGFWLLGLGHQLLHKVTGKGIKNENILNSCTDKKY